MRKRAPRVEEVWLARGRRLLIEHAWPDLVEGRWIGPYASGVARVPLDELERRLGKLCSMCAGLGRRTLHPEAVVPRIDGDPETTTPCADCEGRGWERHDVF